MGIEVGRRVIGLRLGNNEGNLLGFIVGLAVKAVNSFVLVLSNLKEEFLFISFIVDIVPVML